MPVLYGDVNPVVVRACLCNAAVCALALALSCGFVHLQLTYNKLNLIEISIIFNKTHFQMHEVFINHSQFYITQKCKAVI